MITIELGSSCVDEFVTDDEAEVDADAVATFPTDKTARPVVVSVAVMVTVARSFVLKTMSTSSPTLWSLGNSSIAVT